MLFRKKKKEAPAESEKSANEIADTKLTLYFSGMHNAVFGTKLNQNLESVASMVESFTDGLPKDGFVHIGKRVSDEELERKSEETLERYSGLFARLTSFPIDDYEKDANSILYKLFVDAYYALLAYVWAYTEKLEFAIERHKNHNVTVMSLNQMMVHEKMYNDAFDEFDAKRKRFLEYGIELYPEE